jgi:hypothetical protein
MSSLPALRKAAGISSLLSKQDANPKVAKNSKIGQLTAVLHLAPGNMSGHEVCPKRSPGCTAACLHFAGNPLHQDTKTTARIKKTKLFFDNRNLFMNILALEVTNHILNARTKKMNPSFRLNGTSDICFEIKKFILYPETAAIIARKLPEAELSVTNIINMFPTAQFYDYTAVPKRVVPSNYHLTFSMKETNLTDVLTALKASQNIAVVFPVKEIPETYEIDGRIYPVISGDDHDYRPMDPTTLVVVGLKVKGNSGKQDVSGFVQRNQNPLGVLLVA